MGRNHRIRKDLSESRSEATSGKSANSGGRCWLKFLPSNCNCGRWWLHRKFAETNDRSGSSLNHLSWGWEAIDSFGESSIAGESTGGSLGTGWDGDLSSAHSTGGSSVGEGEGSRGGSLGSSLSDTMIRRARGKVYQTCGKIVREKTMSETSDSSIGSGDLSVFSMFSDVLVSLINHEEKEKKKEKRGG
jgi:hypothetical protein